MLNSTEAGKVPLIPKRRKHIYNPPVNFDPTLATELNAESDRNLCMMFFYTLANSRLPSLSENDFSLLHRNGLVSFTHGVRTEKSITQKCRDILYTIDPEWHTKILAKRHIANQKYRGKILAYNRSYYAANKKRINLMRKPQK